MNQASFELDFIGIGSGKCGSTWIYENIVKHPQICDKNLKELNYFSDLYDEQPFSWYRSQFSHADPSTKKGEFSVTYLSHPRAAARIHHHFPDVKLLAIVRDPVKRTYSNYLHAIRKGDWPAEKSFSAYIESVQHLAPARYHEYLRAYYELFPPENIKVIVLEEFVRDVPAGLRDIYTFLGVAPDFLPADYAKRSNEARSYRLLWVENILVRSYRWLSRRGHTRLVKRIVDSGAGELIRRLNAGRQSVAPMDAASRAYLQAYFEPHNAKLAALLGRERAFWSGQG